jgi:hypothetical protein
MSSSSVAAPVDQSDVSELVSELSISKPSTKSPPSIEFSDAKLQARVIDQFHKHNFIYLMDWADWVVSQPTSEICAFHIVLQADQHGVASVTQLNDDSLSMMLSNKKVVGKPRMSALGYPLSFVVLVEFQSMLLSYELDLCANGKTNIPGDGSEFYEEGIKFLLTPVEIQNNMKMHRTKRLTNQKKIEKCGFLLCNVKMEAIYHEFRNFQDWCIMKGF